jgi:hypothetical protein
LEGWTLYLKGWNLYLKCWNLYLKGWTLYLELIYVVIVQVEVVHHEAAVEHSGWQTRQEVLAQVQLVNPLVVAAIPEKIKLGLVGQGSFVQLDRWLVS